MGWMTAHKPDGSNFIREVAPRTSSTRCSRAPHATRTWGMHMHMHTDMHSTHSTRTYAHARARTHTRIRAHTRACTCTCTDCHRRVAALVAKGCTLAAPPAPPPRHPCHRLVRVSPPGSLRYRCTDAEAKGEQRAGAEGRLEQPPDRRRRRWNRRLCRGCTRSGKSAQVAHRGRAEASTTCRGTTGGGERHGGEAGLARGACQA